jgi:hypothetical protein
MSPKYRGRQEEPEPRCLFVVEARHRPPTMVTPDRLIPAKRAAIWKVPTDRLTRHFDRLDGTSIEVLRRQAYPPRMLIHYVRHVESVGAPFVVMVCLDWIVMGV